MNLLKQKRPTRIIFRNPFQLGLVGKFVIFTALVIIITSIAISFVLLNRYRAWNYQRLEHWGKTLAENLSADSELAVLASDRQELGKLARATFRDEDIVYCRIENSRGEVLTESGDLPIGDGEKNRPDLFTAADERDYFQPGDFHLIKAPIITRRIGIGYEDLAFSVRDEDASREPEEITEIGYVYLGLSTERLTREIDETRRLIVTFTLITILIGITATTVIIKYFTRPIFKLLAGTKRIARGDFSGEIPITSSDEIGALTLSFNSMIDSLNKYRDRVEEYSRTLEDQVKSRTADLRKSLQDLRTSQESLIRSEKLAAVGELLTGITHEINNKLAPILGYAELLQLRELDEDSLKMLEIIEEAALNAKSIIDSLLTFARPKELQKSLRNINQLLKQTIDLLSYKLTASGVKLIVDLDPNLPATMVDGDQISQVFLNIINNAQQAMEESERRELRITSWREGENEFFRFQDTGPGITEEARKRIFDPFFSTKRPGKGSGLGMSVSYQIIQNHNGEIKVEDEEEGGATFTVRLPIESGREETAVKEPESPLGTEIISANILAVDDEKDTVSFISSALGESFRVDTATDGNTALEKLRHNTYDCILLDMRMPPPDGRAIYNYLRENRKGEEKKIIFMTGDTFEPNTREFISGTENLLLLKPFPIRDLLETIRRQLNREI